MVNGTSSANKQNSISGSPLKNEMQIRTNVQQTKLLQRFSKTLKEDTKERPVILSSMLNTIYSRTAMAGTPLEP